MHENLAPARGVFPLMLGIMFGAMFGGMVWGMVVSVALYGLFLPVRPMIAVSK